MIRKASQSDASQLTHIAFASKRYWNYPEEYLSVWKPELTITADYVASADVFVYTSVEEIVAFFSLVKRDESLEYKGALLPAGLWLDHMFVSPEMTGKGIGKLMFDFMLPYVVERGIYTVYILADPNAKGFYVKMGCAVVTEFPSSIEGRTTPLLRYDLEQ